MMPIEDLSEDEFNRNFKPKYLDREVLNGESIGEIKRLFAIGDKETAHICCDKYHAHNFECILYHSPASGIVERLILEVRRYRDMLSKISYTIKEG